MIEERLVERHIHIVSAEPAKRAAKAEPPVPSTPIEPGPFPAAVEPLA